ncbi:MAG: hypothetical protein KKG33_11050 [candidate division Zixibacteria bacterium]|nr:hypothetical protein [candidate division Zixibacteria bacterium]MBU1469695.1 hypothetical protein [candidate division Zixibacteria bacterium]MBU2626085.1 hypothetical protein [candidate division Zixibacteria bacterium]
MRKVTFVVVLALAAALMSGLQTVASADTLCGDVNGDGLTYTVGDMVLLARYVLGHAPAVAPLENSDVDLCGSVNISDLALYVDLFVHGLPSSICQPQDDCFPSAEGYEISIGCPLDIPVGNWDSVPMPIYITNGADIAAITLGLRYDYDDIAITSVDVIGSIIPSSWDAILVLPSDSSYIWPVDDSNFVLIVFYWIGQGTEAYIEPQEDGLLATLWLQIPDGVTNQAVDIDSAFVQPAGEFMFSPKTHGTIRPNFVDCGEADIIIGAYVCGDVDGSGAVDIDDVLAMLQCIFVDCSGIPIEQLDPDCSGALDIDDVVYLISYIFSGGPSPCNADGDGLPDC